MPDVLHQRDHKSKVSKHAAGFDHAQARLMKHDDIFTVIKGSQRVRKILLKKAAHMQP